MNDRPEPSEGARMGRGYALANGADAYLTKDRLTVYPLATLALFFVSVVGTWLVRDSRPLPDFAARWTAGHLIVTGRADLLYEPGVQAAIQSNLGGSGLSLFVSPPFVAVLFAPLGALSYPVACSLWAAVSVGSVALSVGILRSFARADSPLRRPAAVLPIMASYPILELLGAGQDTGLVLLAVTIAMYLLRSERDVAAGAVLALGLAKPHLVLLLPIVLVLEKRHASVAAFGLGAVGLAGLSIGVAGWEGCGQWIQLVLGAEYAEVVQRGQSWKSASLPGLLSAILRPDASRLWEFVGLALGLLVGVLAVIALRGPARSTLVTWGLALGAACLASPHTMVYDLVLAVPTIFALGEVAWEAKTRLLLLLWTLGLFLVAPLHALVGQSRWPATTLGAPWHVGLLIWLWLLLATAPNEAARLALGARRAA